jgi:hypothetical protein
VSVGLGVLGSAAPLGRALSICLLGAFEETPWIGYVFGTFLGLVLLVALLMSIVFAPIDLYRRDDIGLAKKLLWVAAFVISAGLVLIVYGAVRYSRTDGHPGW